MAVFLSIMMLYFASVTSEESSWCDVNVYVGSSETYGLITWPKTLAGQQAKLNCTSGDTNKNMYRNCSSSGHWQLPSFQECEGGIVNGHTKKKSNNSRAEDRVKQAKTILNSHHGINRDDATRAIQILEEVVLKKENLNGTGIEIMKSIDAIMNMNQSKLEEIGNATNRVPKILDLLAESIPTNKKTNSRLLTTPNLVLQAVDVNQTTFQGISFSGSISSPYPKLINLPKSVISKANPGKIRIGFIQYKNNKLFQQVGDGPGNVFPSSMVLSASIYDVSTTNLTDPVVLRFTSHKGTTENRTCVFWDTRARQWSGVGCRLCPSQPSTQSVTCCCNHLTSFAVLFSPEKRTSSNQDGVHGKILSIISYVGCIISLIGVFLTFLTYSIFRHLRKTSQQYILMNLCIAIAALLIVFLAGINSTNKTLACQIVAVLLHYLTLVTVLWMGIEAYNLYLQIVKVMAIYQRKFMMKAALVGWGVPMVIVAITATSAAIEYNEGRAKKFYYGGLQACVLDNHIYRAVAWFAPLLVILLFNIIIFVCVMYQLRNSVSITDSSKTFKKQFWTALAIMCLLGLTWLFGALAISDARIVFEYLFCIFNSLQGFFIFFFHCVRIKEVRSQWSLFMSGLGFSRKDNESQSNTKRIGDNHHDNLYVKMKDWIARRQNEEPKKEDEKNESTL